MKIGVVTFSNNINYGASLQEAALIHVLSRWGDAKAINYQNPAILAEQDIVRTDFFRKLFFSLRGMFKRTTQATQTNPNQYARINYNGGRSAYLHFLFKEGSNRLSLMLSDLLHINSRKVMIRKFKQFWAENLIRTDAFSAQQLIDGRCEIFDLYISGSDQIWNLTWLNAQAEKIYFLSFAPPNARKISYASSFGEFDFSPSAKTERIRTYLKSYQTVTVREKSAAENVSHLCGISAECVVDPTLLLTPKEWNAFLQIENDIYEQYGIDYEPYGLVYALYDQPKLIQAAKAAGKQFNCTTYVIGVGCSSVDCRFFADVSPADFVRLFSSAEYVITNSFHGTAFALNFSCGFLTVATHTAERVRSLLAIVQLSERLTSEPTPELMDKEIDFCAVQAILAQERNRSLRILQTAVQGKS